MTGREIIETLRALADSMEKEKPDFGLRDRLIPVLIEWSVDNGHDAGQIVAHVGDLLGGTQLRRLALLAKTVMDDLEKHGPRIVPHLIDTDDNAGERLRKVIKQVLWEAP